MVLKEGMNAPDFVSIDQDEKKITLKDFKGMYVVLYFYPKDNTPGCTVEAKGFTSHYREFKAKKIEVIGVSKDTCASHVKFRKLFSLPFPLLSDENFSLAKKYKVYQKKKFMGKEYMGVVRTTFIIDPHGKIMKIFNNVKPIGHAEEILSLF